MPINVLVSGAGGDVGQGVIKSLHSSCLDLEVYTICISPTSSWLHNVKHSFVAPLSASEEYIPYLIRLIKKCRIDVFFPTVDGEILKISHYKEAIERETGCSVFVGSKDLIEITDDKLKTSVFLKRNGFPSPLSIDLNPLTAESFLEQVGFPVILKKRSGRGSNEVYKISSLDEIEPYFCHDGLMLQEWLDPLYGEYTTGIYLGDDGAVKGSCTFKRQLRNGSTYIAERVVDPILEEPLEQVACALGLKYLNVQSMLRGNQLIPFEFNGRLSGTTAIVSKVFNAPEMFVRERLLGEAIQRMANQSRFIAMRFYDEIYATDEDIEALVARSADI